MRNAAIVDEVRKDELAMEAQAAIQRIYEVARAEIRRIQEARERASQKKAA